MDSEKCVGCGSCVEDCNTNALSLGNCLSLESYQQPERPDRTETEWTEDMWDYNYRTRQMVNDLGTSPCKTYCPAHISIQGYIKKAGEGNYADALKIIKKDNPFPAVCGRICPRDCEQECTRNEVDESIAIDDIKKFIADKELESEFRYIPKVYEQHDGQVAVIGAGPSGLSCAYYLATYGFHVTVFEKENVLGGMLTMGIPSFRLEKDVINSEIDVLRELGVQFKTGVEVGKDISLDQLRKDGFNAFYVAIGAQNGRKLGIEGENTEGVISGVDFLRQVSLGNATELNGKVVVIGGGNVAIDVARTAVRLGAQSTDLFCLESKEEMPALPEEQEEAENEGVAINNSWGPKRILEEDGKLVGVEFMRCTSVYNDEGAFSPVYDESDTITVACDHVIASIGQSINWGELLKGSKAEVTRRNTLSVDAKTLQSDEVDVFSGGDAVTGPKFAIDAIAMGKTAAITIRRYLLGQNLTVRREREYRALDKENINIEGFDRLPRQRPVSVKPEEAKKTFDDTRQTLTEEQIKEEAKRCLGCGITFVNEDKCIGCGICSTRCEFDAIKLVRRYDIEPSYGVDDYAKAVQEYAIERQEKIARKKEEMKNV